MGATILVNIGHFIKNFQAKANELRLPATGALPDSGANSVRELYWDRGKRVNSPTSSVAGYIPHSSRDGDRKEESMAEQPDAPEEHIAHAVHEHHAATESNTPKEISAQNAPGSPIGQRSSG